MNLSNVNIFGAVGVLERVLSRFRVQAGFQPTAPSLRAPMPGTPLNRNNVGALNKNRSVEQAKPRVLRPVLNADAIAADRKKRKFRARFPLAEFLPELGCGDAHLLKCDLDLQLNHVDCYGAMHQQRLERIYRKVNYNLKSGEPGYWKNQREWKEYDRTATLVALSSYHRADTFCDCGFHGYSCGDRYVCLRCCHKLLAEPALLEFGQCFTEEQECYFVVMSLSGEPDEKKRLIFKDLTKSEMQQIKLSGRMEQAQPPNFGIPFDDPLNDDARIYFEIYAKVIHDFTGNKRGQVFSGAFGGPELAVRFLPLAALPHANYVVWSPGMSREDVRRLRRALRQKIRGSRRLKNKLYPKLAIYRIQSSKDLRAVTGYIFKPINFALAYHLAAESADCNPADLRVLNNQVNYFFDTLRVTMSDVRRMTRYGFCSPSSKLYVGHVTLARKTKRQKDATRRQRRRKEDAEIRKRFPGYEPYKRRKSSQQRADSLRMRLCYQRLMEDGELPANLPKRWFRKGKPSQGLRHGPPV